MLLLHVYDSAMYQLLARQILMYCSGFPRGKLTTSSMCSGLPSGKLQLQSVRQSAAALMDGYIILTERHVHFDQKMDCHKGCSNGLGTCCASGGIICCGTSSQVPSEHCAGADDLTSISSWFCLTAQPAVHVCNAEACCAAGLNYCCLLQKFGH